ncbi:hypothetical protein GCM10010277_33770 [Streptomyces longisporoflavus]|nr:hypothetical protein GCM10010277_33770 [Streptomyces longisporoflavus]
MGTRAVRPTAGDAPASVPGLPASVSMLPPVSRPPPLNDALRAARWFGSCAAAVTGSSVCRGSHGGTYRAGLTVPAQVSVR